MINLKQCKVLLVDDIKANINIMRKILKDKYNVSYVQDGESALKYIRSNPTIDLILLDIMMPGIDGYEVCKRLKADERTKNIPVIFITSKSKTQDETKGLELGAVDYIIKPFSKPIIRARVRNHLMMKKQIDLLENLSNLDGLTGIPNRRNFDKFLNLECNRAARSASPLSLIFMDIDFFKKFNDNYGHAAGDRCLKKVACALSDSIKRPTDFIARYGGEEFVAVLPETDFQGALMVAQSIQQNIGLQNIQHAYSSVASHVTMSLGAITIVPTKGISPLFLIEAADDALYEAKEGGRNMIKAYEINN
ncbi:two-component system, chemotaxis family, response regulator WspR [Candidatus Magnetomoraceae bacterium gMMP-15]